MLSKFFVKHPIFATVLALVMVLAGGITLFTLPIAQYPDITPPTVQVTAIYPGADAETIAETDKKMQDIYRTLSKLEDSKKDS